MRSLKMIFVVVFFAASVVVSVLTYIQSHGAGIATGLLLALVIIGYVLDNRHHLTVRDIVPEQDVATTGTMAAQRQVAMRHARVLSQQEDGDVRVSKH